LRLDYLQLHGGEPPERVEQIRLEFGIKVIKALGIGGPDDLIAAKAYDGVADLLLFDARPGRDASRPAATASLSTGVCCMVKNGTARGSSPAVWRPIRSARR